MSPARAPGWRGRRRLGLALLGLALAGGAGWSAATFGSPGPAAAGTRGPALATSPVVRQVLTAQTPVNASLGYARSFIIRGQGGGTLTWLPAPGRVIRPGQVLYRVDNGVPVVLLHGSVPAWRPLAEGLTGADVTQLNHDLVALGYASRPDVAAAGWTYYSWATAAGVQRLESARGVTSPPGSLALGSVVFEPAALRVTGVPGSLGAPAAGPVLAGTSDQHVVTISLGTAQETDVAVGDAVTVTLPDGASTPGRVTAVGSVASGAPGNATITVTAVLTHPAAAGALDQAPVTVYLTTGRSRGAVLAVPVAALLAQPGRAGQPGYAVEITGARQTRRLVRVQVGIFDDNSGLVQVSGPLTPGERVVVPAT
jgi:hypothetical protein